MEYVFLFFHKNFSQNNNYHELEIKKIQDQKALSGGPFIIVVLLEEEAVYLKMRVFVLIVENR